VQDNIFTRGTDQYPMDLTSAYNLLLNYKPPPTAPTSRRNYNRDNDEVSRLTFLQHGAPIPGSDGTLDAYIKCYNCQSLGHYVSVCPQADQEQGGVQLLQATQEMDESISEFTFIQAYGDTPGFSFQQSEARSDTRPDIIPNTWVLLDSQSTVTVFKNRHLLSNIRPSTNKLCVHTNGVIQTSSLKGTVKHFGDVWYNENSPANILCMAAVRNTCRITMDTSVEAAMHVHCKDGTIMTFREYQTGLYYYDVADAVNSTPNTTSTKRRQQSCFHTTGDRRSGSSASALQKDRTSLRARL
jgi:hypothetical protein